MAVIARVPAVVAVRRIAGVCTVGAAVAAALIPWPEAIVEQWYSTGVYPLIQQPVTWLSNHVPFALADVALPAVVALWIAMAVAEVRRVTPRRIASTLGRIAARTVIFAAVIYLAFLVLW